MSVRRLGTAGSPPAALRDGSRVPVPAQRVQAAGVHSEAHSHLPLPWWQAQRAAGWEGPLRSPAKLVWGPAQAFISCAMWSRSQCIC